MNELIITKPEPRPFFQQETWADIPWIYSPKLGLWYIINGIVYNNGGKMGKITKPHTTFCWAHQDLETFEPKLYDAMIAGKIFNKKICKVYNHYEYGSPQRDRMEEKALDAVYRYIDSKFEVI